MKRVILKISGEALANSTGAGINPELVRKTAIEIKELFEKGTEIGIVIGAGNIWRGRDAKAIGMSRASADYMGMLGTLLNSLAMQNTLEDLGLETRVMTSLSAPSVAEPYIRRKALNYLNKGIIVIFAGGTGSPYFSTDTAAALRAAEMSADVVLMAKNGVDGVYDADPKKDSHAHRYSNLSYDEMLSKHLEVMDLTAATLCRENDIKIIVFDMNIEGNISKVIEDYSIGTIIEK